MARRKHIPLDRLFVVPRMCGQKRRYGSQQEAEQVKTEQELLTPDLALRVYKCIKPGCSGWHLTRHRSGMIQ